MVKLGYGLSCQAHPPHDMVRYIQLAETAGFSFALLTDAAHAGIRQQESSAFVWSIVGAIAQATSRLPLGVQVRCAPMPLPPAILAQAAATAAALLSRRFFLCMETGETRHDYLFGRSTARPDSRLSSLEEAVQVLRLLWQGGPQQHWGQYYPVASVCLAPPAGEKVAILIAAELECTARLAGRLGDGFVGTAPREELLAAFQAAGGAHKPRYGKLAVCWTADERCASDLARQWWTDTVRDAASDLALPAAALDTIAQVSAETATVVCGPDPGRHLAAIHAFAAAGYDHVYIEQVGTDQKGCLQFYQQEILPRLR